jgi:hypothetical protein
MINIYQSVDNLHTTATGYLFKHRMPKNVIQILLADLMKHSFSPLTMTNRFVQYITAVYTIRMQVDRVMINSFQSSSIQMTFS